MSAIKKSETEVFEDCPKDKAYFENAIYSAILDYYYSNYQAETVEQIAKCSQNSFIAACEYAQKMCISRGDLMTTTPHTIHPVCGGIAFNETYNTETVKTLCEVYLSICFRFDKVPSIYGFSVLSGIEKRTLLKWVDEEKLSCKSRRHSPKNAIFEIKAARAQSLQNIAISGGKGTVGAIACLNNEVWGKTQVESPEQIEQNTAAALPVFDTDKGVFLESGEKVSAGVSDALGLPIFNEV